MKYHSGVRTNKDSLWQRESIFYPQAFTGEYQIDVLKCNVEIDFSTSVFIYILNWVAFGTPPHDISFVIFIPMYDHLFFECWGTLLCDIK